MKKAAAIAGIMLAAAGVFFILANEEYPVVAIAHGDSSPIALFSPEVQIFAAGDMMFDRQIRQVGAAEGSDYLFACMDASLHAADFAVANLEGPITTNVSVSAGSVVGSPANYYFTFPTTTAELLSRHNFRAVGIGNNHIMNFGILGLISTQGYLSQAGVGYFGGIAKDEGVFETSDQGIDLAFVGYNEFGGSSPAEVAQKIAGEHAKGRVVIVYAHWGDEYIDASPRLRPIAQLFSDSGAAAIIGAHPHVVLGHEYIGNTLVYYSLGNFIFDQYWNSSVSTGLTLILHVDKNGYVTADEHPVQILRNGQTCPSVQ